MLWRMREKAALKGEKTHCAKYPNVDTCGEPSQTTSLKSRYDAASNESAFLPPVRQFSRISLVASSCLPLSFLPPPQLGSYFRISEAKVVHSSSLSLWSRLSQLQISRKIRSEQGRRTRGVITPRSYYSVTAPQREEP